MADVSPLGYAQTGPSQVPDRTQMLGKNDFLTLLVTKLQHQDPLNPMDDQDFIAQLAQFSSLEQMHNIAEGISTSNQWDYLQMQSLNNVMASGLIGKEVKAAYDSIYLEAGDSSQISYTLPQQASEVTFTIVDASGNTVATITETNVAPGTHTIAWDGKDSFGNRAPEGLYSVVADAAGPDGNRFQPQMSLIGVVETIIYRDGSAYLKVNGVEVALGDIYGIGQPGSFGGDGGE